MAGTAGLRNCHDINVHVLRLCWSVMRLLYASAQPVSCFSPAYRCFSSIGRLLPLSADLLYTSNSAVPANL